jgi:hypothetical protein
MIKLFFTTLLALSVLIAGCKKLLSGDPLEDPNDVKTTEGLQIIVANDTLIVHVVDTTAIWAKVPKDAGIIDISFTATAGLFIATASKTIKQMADSLGSDGRYAKVIYVADTVAATVYITAETSNVRARTTIIVNK